MDYYNKKDISQMTDSQLVDAFEQAVVNETKAINFTKRGITPKMEKEFNIIREELLSRMKAREQCEQ